MLLVKLDTQRITDWDTFHNVFADVFGFPGFYGQNMDAWIDCMTFLDDPTAEMTKVHVPPGGVVVLELENVDEFIKRCPEQYEAIIDCAALVNWRRIEKGDPAVLALSFYKSP
jgi:RNAse (barnase) inhibitor barstar